MTIGMQEEPTGDDRLLLALEALVSDSGTLDQRMRVVETIVAPLNTGNTVYPFAEWLRDLQDSDDQPEIARRLLNCVLGSLRENLRAHETSIKRLSEEKEDEAKRRREYQSQASEMFRKGQELDVALSETKQALTKRLAEIDRMHRTITRLKRERTRLQEKLDAERGYTPKPTKKRTRK